MAVTIKDIAMATGISTSTISRVLSGRGYVEENTRKKVEAAIKESGYVYKPVMTKRNSIDMAMIVAGDTGSPVFSENIKGIASIFEALNIPYVGTYGIDFSAETQEKYMMRAIRSRFKGLIILSPIETHAFLKIVHNVSMPCIAMNRPVDQIKMDQICMDNKAAGKMAVDYLVRRGHRKILFVGVVSSASTEYRKLGFLEGMKQNGLTVEESDMMLIKDDYRSATYLGSLLAVTRKDVSAIYTVNETITSGLIYGLKQCGVRVPEDKSIVATDNTQMSIISTPTLTTVGCNHFNMGAEAAKLFVERLNEPKGEKKQMFFKPEIIERESVVDFCE